MMEIIDLPWQDNGQGMVFVRKGLRQYSIKYDNIHKSKEGQICRVTTQLLLNNINESVFLKSIHAVIVIKNIRNCGAKSLSIVHAFFDIWHILKNYNIILYILFERLNKGWAKKNA